MEKLNYDLLDRLVDAHAHHNLDIVKVGVTRFGDDKAEIQLGETVPFVANVKFVVNERTYALLKEHQLQIARGDTLFWINNRGEIKTDCDVAIDSDDIARWVDDHYEFVFRVRGVDRTALRPYRREPVDSDRFATVEPWLQEINTLAVRGEVIDIDFDVKPKTPEPRPVRKAVLSRSAIPAAFDQATLGLRLEIQGRCESIAKLKNARYSIALYSEDDPDLKLSVIVENVWTTDAPRSALPADRTRAEITSLAYSQPNTK
ncbi:MAG TPA: hypothetical protein VFT22_27670 [Kofleriaceae bacterium]|nr:hypothetical protein [Kofleriaceae bacterium]